MTMVLQKNIRRSVAEESTIENRKVLIYLIKCVNDEYNMGGDYIYKSDFNYHDF